MKMNDEMSRNSRVLAHTVDDACIDDEWPGKVLSSEQRRSVMRTQNHIVKNRWARHLQPVWSQLIGHDIFCPSGLVSTNRGWSRDGPWGGLRGHMVVAEEIRLPDKARYQDFCVPAENAQSCSGVYPSTYTFPKRCYVPTS